MKKFIFALLFTLFPICAFAQNQGELLGLGSAAKPFLCRVNTDRVELADTEEEGNFPSCNPRGELFVDGFTADARLAEALEEIYVRYGDIVSVEQKQKTLIKYGRCDNVTTATTGTTIWSTCADRAHETFVAANTNSIDRVSSSNASDTQTVTFEGHWETASAKTFSTQSIVLSGQTPIPIPTPLNRITRGYNASSTDLLGTVYGYENTTASAGKPTDTTKIHLSVIGPLHNQSAKASTTLSNTDYWIITNFYADVLSKTAAYADVSLQIRENGKVFRTIATISAADTHQGKFGGGPYLIAPKNSDVRLVAVGSGTISVSGGIEGFLASVVS